MLYQELHQRYGSHIATRLQAELSTSEFKHVTVTELPAYLDMRAEAAHKEYQAKVDNPVVKEAAARRAGYIENLFNRWQEADEIAYLVHVAEDTTLSLRTA